MTDNNNDNRGRPRKPGGDKPQRPFGGKPGGDATLRRRPDAGGWSPLAAAAPAPFPEDGEIVRAPRPDRDARPFRAKNEGERPFRAREGDRPGARPAAPEKVYRPRVERPERKPKGPSLTQRTVERSAGDERIAKVMARAGLCSRRDAEVWIETGRVSVNGEKITSPALNVGPGDQIKVDGKPLPGRERTRLWLYHKERGLVTTSSDPEGRPTIFSALPAELPRVVTIGRLDINTEGLLLLTNDGGLSRMLELPATGWLRRYRVRAHGDTDQAKLDALREGVTIEGIDYMGIEARLDRQQGANVWLTMGLREGKNREIKKVLEHIGLEVNRLIRISFGPFQLGELAEGGVEEIKTRILMDQLGPQLIADAGADFDAPLAEKTGAPAVTEFAARTREVSREKPQFSRDPSRDKPRFSRDVSREESQDAPRADRPQPGKRKHISIIRAEERAAEAGDRKRIERGATADRKGRAVRVERVVPVRAKPRAGEENRNARRFRNERDETRAPHSKPQMDTRPPDSRDARKPFRARPDSDRPRPPRADGEQRSFSKPRDGGDRPRAPRPDGDRPRPPRTGGERPFKHDGDRKFGDRPPRADAEQRSFRKPREDGDRPRAPRSDGDRPRPPRDGARPFNRDGDRKFGDRPPRRDGPPGDRPPRRDGPAGERPFRGKPSGGRAGGKPGGDKPRGKPGARPGPPRRDG